MSESFGSAHFRLTAERRWLKGRAKTRVERANLENGAANPWNRSKQTRKWGRQGLIEDAL